MSARSCWFSWRKSNKKGFALGNSYVSFVDLDDLYEASAFVQCAHLLDTYPQLGAVYTAEVAINADGKNSGGVLPPLTAVGCAAHSHTYMEKLDA